MPTPGARSGAPAARRLEHPPGGTARCTVEVASKFAEYGTNSADIFRNRWYLVGLGSDQIWVRTIAPH